MTQGVLRRLARQEAGYGNPAYGEGGGKWAGTPIPAIQGAGAGWSKERNKFMKKQTERGIREVFSVQSSVFRRDLNTEC